MEDLPNLDFMFFDRHEIHIQAFVDFINGQVIIFRSSPPHFFENIYSTFLYVFIYIYINIYFKHAFKTNGGCTF